MGAQRWKIVIRFYKEARPDPHPRESVKVLEVTKPDDTKRVSRPVLAIATVDTVALNSEQTTTRL